MHIVTWNMGCASRASQYRKTHGEAWDYLLQKLQPEVTIVQEALVSKIDEARRNHVAFICKLKPDVDAGTAIGPQP
jgi:hypothetical protein